MSALAYPAVPLPLSAAPLGGMEAGPASTRLASKSIGRPGLIYEAVQKLGEGAFGVAHLVRDKNTGQLRVLKTINKRRSQVPDAQLEREIRNMKACDHPHIVRLYEYYEDYENIYLIMERAAGGELHQVVLNRKKQHRHLPERWVATVTKQCLQAVDYVHSMGIIHKDLKSENIMLLFECDVDDPRNPPHAVIIDLGIAELFTARLGRRARCSVVAGTPTHMAPEVWRGNFGQVADVWSLGVVLFELLSGEIPFLCSSLNSASEWLRLHKQGPNWSLLSHNSNQARAVCQRMLSSDERMRPTASQCLGHAWFKEMDSTAGGSVAIDQEETNSLSPANSARPSFHGPGSPSKSRSEINVADVADYTDRSKFEKTVMFQVAANLHTSQVARIADTFFLVDLDRTGLVYFSDLLHQLQELGVNKSDAEAYVNCLETDTLGRVEYAELVSGCIGLLYESLRGLLWQSFCEIDVDGNGVLDPVEVRAVVARLDAGYGFPSGGSPGSVDEVINRINLDSHGQISFDELCRHFLPPRPVIPTSNRNDVLNHLPTLRDDEFEQLLDTIEASANDRFSPEPCLEHQDRLRSRVQKRCDSGLSHLLAMTPEPDAMIEQLANCGQVSHSVTDASLDEELSTLLAEMSSQPH
jgi:serine/threonine protein kinase